jgi:hypothetical protein
VDDTTELGTWVERYTAKGYRVVAPASPASEAIDELRRDPSSFSTRKVSFSRIEQPGKNRRAVPLTPEQFHYVFATR